MQKTSFKTRLLALLTAVFMVIMCVPFAAFADGSVNVKFKGDTSSDDWNKVYAEKTFAAAADEIEAPELPEGYDYWKSNNGTKDLKAGDKLTFADVKDAANGMVNYTPVKDQTPKTQTIYVSYIEEGNPSNVVGREQFQLDKSETSFNASVLEKVPEGWELARTGDISLGGSDSVNVEVRKIVTTQTIYVSYIEEGNPGNVVGREQFQLDKSETYFNASVLKKVPEGWVLARTGDISLGGSDCVNVEVRKAATTKTVYVNYVDEDGNVPVENGHEQITIDKDATYFNASLLKSVPVGYELCSVGDISLGGSDSVNVMVRKSAAPEVKNVKINFYCPEEKKQVAEPTVVVNADATCVNSSAYAALVPAGYELVEVGDMPIRDGYVYAEVRKVATKTIKINYYSEEEEKQIAEVEMTVPADATYVNTSKLTAPAGYELVLAGDLPIRDGYVYAAVRKVPTTTIKISYVDEATDKEVGTEDLVVNQGTTVVNFNVLKSVPAGYELCEVGDFYVGNGSAKVMVRKTKTNNGSSSSSASSSSNTTNTSASQKQVVKAAAAPANTTKVLPKTGATNAAPLIGGSLAVVALLMGYGVYGLVLRKKD